MQLTFWGVRGSIPTPGEATRKWGGNSACIEVSCSGHEPLVLDCGTGARGLGAKLVGSDSRELTLLFSHLHVDHIFGFPYFGPVYTPGYRLNVGIPAYSDEEARERLGRFLNGTFHPTRLRDIPADLNFFAVRPARTFVASGYDVTGIRLNHPGGSIGYRIRTATAAQDIAYVTDSAPFARPGEGVIAGEEAIPAEARLVEFLRGCDTVVYDTMYSRGEYLEKMTWGHSYPEYAVAVCRAAGVRRLVLFHHNPEATDAVLDERLERFAKTEGLVVTQAAEGMVLDVP